jgi:hypothetical protein
MMYGQQLEIPKGGPAAEYSLQTELMVKGLESTPTAVTD